jgi:regulator of nucleoside diphosphate kinase
MNNEPLIMLRNEQELLKKHYKDANLSEFNKKRLLDELTTAHIIDDGYLPEDVVCLKSKVEFKEIVSGQQYSFRIVLPSEANIKEGKISVFAPLAIALLGCRQGARVDWEMPAGIKTFEILKVTQNKIPSNSLSA